MELLTVQNLTIERQGRTLLAAADLTLREGMRVGLIGANGSGKSSLLEVVAGLRPASAGRVRRAPGIEVGYLPQENSWDERQNAWEAALLGLAHTTRLERELRSQEELLSRGAGSLELYGEIRESFDRAGGYAAEAGLRESLAALGIGDELLALQLGDLSGGERARLALARVLAARPPLLLLDEPSNHLDLPAIDWLAERLRRWPGGLLVVSHDREILDRVSTHTAELRDGGLLLSRGGYTRLRQQQGIIRRTDERRERERRKEAARLEGIAQELRSWGTAKAQRRRRRLERALDLLDEGPPPVSKPFLPAPGSREAEGRLLEARHLGSVQGERSVISVDHLVIEAGDKVALLGPNGSGKSTLLRLLAGELGSDDPKVEFWWNRDLKILFAGQHDRGLDDRRPVQEQLERLVSGERARMLLALCGVPQESWQRPPGTLSGGERARAGLARILAGEANLLLLDEPSNDLDLVAIENLQQALETSPAALVIATHDRSLARVADRIWAIEEGRLVEYRGGLDGCLAGRRRLEPGLAEEISRDAADPPAGAERQLPAAAVSEPEEDLERLELERLGVEARLDDPLRLGDRERQRLEQRRRELFDLLSLAYDRRLPPPLPAFTVREGAVRLTADYSENGLRFFSDAPVTLELIKRGQVGHLTLREEDGSELLPWARGALLDAAARLAFCTLAPDFVQHQSASGLNSRLFEATEGGWWLVARARFEVAEGWQPEAAGESAAPVDGEKRSRGRRDRIRGRKRRHSRRSAVAGREAG